MRTLDGVFLQNIKRELVNDANVTSIEQAQLGIVKYIETYNNTKPLHSALIYMSPTDFEKQTH